MNTAVTAMADEPGRGCPTCGTFVTNGAFCGRCGALLNPRRRDRPVWLRPSAFCVAPNESVFRPAIASSLVPHLSSLTRRPVSVGLVLIVVALAAGAQAALPGAVITVASLGLVLLLFMYSRGAGVLATLPRWAVALTIVLAVGIAVGWVLLTGDLVTREAGSPFDAGSAGRRVLRDGLGVAEGGALLMLVPAVVVRLLWRSRRDGPNGLDGFVIGVLGALVFTATATLTRLAPQLVTEPVAGNLPVPWLLFEAAVRGVAVPITAACAGGLAGAALWFGPGPRTRRTAVTLAVGLCGAAVLTVYAVVGRADIEGVSQTVVLFWHLAMAVFALIAVRVGLQLAVLHGAPEPGSGVHLECPHCGRPVPASAFCPRCGVAIGAGVQPPSGRPRVLSTWLITLTGVSALLIGLQALAVTPPPEYNCPPDCGRPPSGIPVSANPRFSPPGQQFSVAYPGPGGNFAITTDATGVTARFTAGDRGVMRLTGEPAAGRTAKQVARDFLTAKFPTARVSYEVPNAKLGFAPGYGEVADVFPSDLDTTFTRTRVVVIAAVKNDFALIAGGAGPYRRFGPDSGPGRPSAANVQIAEEMGRYVNSFMWAGDPPR